MPMASAKTDVKTDLDLPIPDNLASMTKTKRHALYKFYADNGRFFTVEYSSSNRSKCRACKRIIAKGDLRFRHIVCGQKCFQHKSGRGIDTCGRWHIACMIETQAKHPDWFLHTNSAWQPIQSLDQVLGSKALSQSDRDSLSRQLEEGSDELVKVERDSSIDNETLLELNK